MPTSRARKILGLVTTAALFSVPATASPGPAPAKPLVGANGRPACGNTLSKSGGAGRRREAKANLAALAKLIETGNDQKDKAYRDQLIARVRHDLEQMEVCEPRPAAKTAAR